MISTNTFILNLVHIGVILGSIEILTRMYFGVFAKKNIFVEKIKNQQIEMEEIKYSNNK